jgi:hypothetical protein
MNNEPDPQLSPRQHQLVMWVLWFAFLQGVVCFRIFLVKPTTPGTPPPADVMPWLVALLPVLASVIVRWLVLPRTQVMQQALTFLILGIAFAEATSLFAIFLSPSKLNLLFCASVFGILQFAPVWADRFFASESQPDPKDNLPRPPR